MANHIFVVEDEPDLLLVITERLKTNGYSVTSAPNGRIALELIQKNQPALIITDVIMPELDGFGLLKELKKNSTTAKIPVIVLTARGKMSDTFASMGAADFLAKPFDDKVLLATVNKYLSDVSPAEKMTEKPLEIAAEKPAPAINSPNPKPPATSKKVFIAGMDPAVITRMTNQLTEKGLYVDSTVKAPEIITKINTLCPNMIFIELPLEDIQPRAIISDLKKSTAYREVPVFLYSFLENHEGGTVDIREKALSVDAAKEECLEAGAQEYIGSYTERSFLKTLSKYL